MENAIWCALQNEVEATKGVAPYNFCVRVNVLEVVSVRLLDWDATVRSACETSQLEAAPPLFQAALPASPSLAGCAVAGLRWEADGRREFVPFAELLHVDLLCAGAPCAPHDTQTRDLWAYELVTRGDAAALQYAYVDRRPARNVRPLVPITALVVLRLSAVCDAEERLQLLLERMPRLDSGELERQRSPGRATAAASAAAADDLCVITEESITVSPADPVMSLAISHPVRPRTCAHAQCFDLAVLLLQLRDQKTPPKGLSCPICNAAYRFGDLVFDTTFAAFLQHVGRPARMSLSAYHALSPGGGSSGVVRHNGRLYHLSGTLPVSRTVTGNLLKPVLNIAHYYVVTGIEGTFPRDAAVPVVGAWETYPGIPCRYFVRTGR
eukprot:Rhum_TRINITY_DN1218_c0_g1::Rhum_TRINITY_DN1218_c0_g1_i1::g.3730::m.3730